MAAWPRQGAPPPPPRTASLARSNACPSSSFLAASALFSSRLCTSSSMSLALSSGVFSTRFKLGATARLPWPRGSYNCRGACDCGRTGGEGKVRWCVWAHSRLGHPSAEKRHQGGTRARYGSLGRAPGSQHPPRRSWVVHRRQRRRCPFCWRCGRWAAGPPSASAPQWAAASRWAEGGRPRLRAPLR